MRNRALIATALLSVLLAAPAQRALAWGHSAAGTLFLGDMAVKEGAHGLGMAKDARATAEQVAPVAVLQFGSPAGVDAVNQLRGIIASHKIVGPDVVLNAIAKVTAANPGSEPAAVAVVQQLQQNTAVFNNKLVIARKQLMNAAGR